MGRTTRRSSTAASARTPGARLCSSRPLATPRHVPGALRRTLADLRRTATFSRMAFRDLPAARSRPGHRARESAVEPGHRRARGGDPDTKEASLPRLRALAHLVEEGRSRSATAGSGWTRAVDRNRHPTRGPRSVVSSSPVALAPRTTDLARAPPPAGPEFDWRPVRRAAGLA